MNDDNQKKLLKEKKDFVTPELAAVGLMGIIGQTLISFIAWVVFECCWNRIKAWWQKKKKQS